MPEISGEQLAETLWAVNPSLPAILLSGNPDLEQTGAAMLKVGFRACLTKPMSPSDLAKAILRVVPDMKLGSQVVQN